MAAIIPKEESIKGQNNINSRLKKIEDDMAFSQIFIQEIADTFQKQFTKMDDHDKVINVLIKQNKISREEIIQQRSVVDEQDNKLKEYQEKVEKQGSDLKQQQEDVQRQKDDLKEQKYSSVQYFGLFVAVFTTISIDIQLLRFAQSTWSIAGLILLVNTAPLFFFWLIKSFLEWDYISKEVVDWLEEEKNQKLKALFWHKLLTFLIVFIFIFFAGCSLLYIGEKGATTDTVDNDDKELVVPDSGQINENIEGSAIEDKINVK